MKFPRWKETNSMIDIQQQGIITLVRNALKNEKNTVPEGFNFELAIPVAN